MNKKKLQNKPHMPFFMFGIVVMMLYLFYSASFIGTYSSFSYEMLDKTSKLHTMALGSAFKSKLALFKSIGEADMLCNSQHSIYEKFEALQEVIEPVNIIAIEISDTLGNSISSTGEERYIFNEAAFQKALQGETAISAPGFSSALLTEVIVYTIPVFDSGGDVANVLNISTDSEDVFAFIRSFLESVEESTDKEAYILDAAGNIIFEITGGIEPSAELTGEAALKKSGSMSFKQNGKRMIGVFDPIENTDWIALTVVPTSFLHTNMSSVMKIPTALGILIFIIIFASFIYASTLSKKLKLERQSLDFVIRSANLFIILLSRNGSILSANNNLLDTTGYALEELTAKKIGELFGSDTYLSISQLFDEGTTGKTLKNIRLPLVKRSGATIYVLWQKELLSDGNIRLVGYDISELRESEDKLKRLAYRDTLTDLPNKISLNEYVNDLLYKGEEFALYYMDLDNFKYINETYGHEVGDKFLLAISKNIQSLSIQNAVMFRHGGDEFAFVYSNSADLGEYGDYANILINIVSHDYFINGIKINTSCSIGISIFPKNGDCFGDLYSASEISMNKAKEMGKSRTIFFNTQMKNELTEYYMLVEDLKDAIKNNELVMYYQPQYDFSTGKPVGYEALMRWFRKGEEFVPPNVFISIAEKNGLISDLSLFAINEAIVFLNKIKDLGHHDISVAVNISSKQFADADLVETLITTIGDSYKHIGSLEFELTEPVLLKSMNVNLNKLTALRNYGIKFALDDYGTGYSSLTYLQKFPFDFLKIDKSYVDTILDNNGSRAVVSTIINMAHALNLKVIAEGVERREQFEKLAGMGCNICQGYYTGKPMPDKEALKLLDKNIILKENL